MGGVLVLIVTHNGSKFIKNCINSIYTSQEVFEILIIDNFSNDDTVDIVKSNFPEVNIIVSKENLGFGKANNIGFKYAIQKGYDSIFLLNQDTVIFPKTITNLLSVFEKLENIGFLSPLHLDNTETAFESNFEYFLNMSFRRKLISKMFFRNNNLNYAEVDFINAAAWLVPASTLKVVGGFNPIFPHYSEDIDYFNRLKYFQFRNYIVFNSFMIHFSVNDKNNQNFKSLVKRELFERVAVMSDINHSFFYLIRKVFLKILNNFILALYPFNIQKIKFEFFILFNLIMKSKSIINGRSRSKKGNSFLV